MSDSNLPKPTTSKPKLRGLVHNSIKKNLYLATASCIIVGIYTQMVYAGRKERYANFYKNYDIEKEFDRMRKLGLFESCDSSDNA